MLLDSADFIPPGSREKLAAAVLRLAARIAFKPVLGPNIPVAWQRHWFERMTRLLQTKNPSQAEFATLGGVAGEWTRPSPPAANAKAAILYLHGGAYCIGSPATHRSVAAHLAQITRLPVFAADYRLGPERPFPGAVEDAFAVYRCLVDTARIAIAGDSAGAGLALATALTARERRVAPPAALVLFSPWVDLTPSALPERAPTGEVILNIKWINDCARHYLAGAETKTPLASPIFGDLQALPPTLIQSGTDDILHGQALRLYDALFQAGNAVRCEIIRSRWHAFQLLAGWLPSADAAIARAGQFIRLNIAP